MCWGLVRVLCRMPEWFVGGAGRAQGPAELRESHPHLLSHLAAARAKPSLPKCFVPYIRKLTLRRSPML